MNSRVSVKKRSLPFYSEGEETLNVVSHAIGVLIGISMVVTISQYHQNTTQLVSGILFGFSLIILYAMSCTYHGLSRQGAELEDKKKLQVVDHCSIPMLITGTYIPFALCIIEPARPGLGWTLLGIVCTLACIVTVLTIIDLERFKAFIMVGYFVMGGSLFVGAEILFNALTPEGFTLFLVGGATYAIGAIFYRLGGYMRMKWMHSVFHFFCLFGSLLHYFCICLYVFKY